MKAITIWQPWSSLLACGAKGFETRSWATSYRGPIAIHAAKKDIFDALATISVPVALEMKKLIGAEWKDLPTGAVIATANLIGCHKIYAPHGFRALRFGDTPFIRKENGKTYTADDVELALGDWTPGRYAWEFSDMKAISPIQAKGKQGLWNWDGGGLDV